MKGVIFDLFEEYVTDVYGPDAFDDLLDATNLETEDPYVGPGTYPAGDLLALVSGAEKLFGPSVDDLLRGFGTHAFPALAESVANLIEELTDARSFLANLESVIHTEVRKLDPDADPARFTIIDSGPSELLLSYESPLGLFSLVEGFLDGMGVWFGEPVQYELVATNGTNGTFCVRFAEVASIGSDDAAHVAGE